MHVIDESPIAAPTPHPLPSPCRCQTAGTRCAESWCLHADDGSGEPAATSAASSHQYFVLARLLARSGCRDSSTLLANLLHEGGRRGYPNHEASPSYFIADLWARHLLDPARPKAGHDLEHGLSWPPLLEARMKSAVLHAMSIHRIAREPSPLLAKVRLLAPRIHALGCQGRQVPVFDSSRKEEGQSMYPASGVGGRVEARYRMGSVESPTHWQATKAERFHVAR